MAREQIVRRNKASRETHFFVRKNQAVTKNAQKLLFFIKKPVMQVRGVPDFIVWVVGDRGEL